ncbi:hypothetical protein E0H56_03735 [Rhizobium leguminosarum bv. viciae]|uniref:hypothetical protein n=1 Tax=Rhizobium leguminosarum TaxID=384 RepID=UPI001040DA3E|nr:hypothetical protein [Rhizobium leguminosarum]TBZ98228.1 hypothetical protein E0H56_03735 [Rhizobium leguminosarum bv. viciae]
MTDGYFFSPSTCGFYLSGIHSDLPSDAVAISDAEHEGLLAAQDAGAEIVVGNGGAPEAKVPEIDLATHKAAIAKAIDAAAERERLKYITAGAGQALTYQQKADEATRYLAATNPDPSDYPLLSAEVGVTASDIAGVAQVVKTAFTLWQVIGAGIERARLTAKAAVDAAQSAEEADAVYSSIAWPSPGGEVE